MIFTYSVQSFSMIMRTQIIGDLFIIINSYGQENENFQQSIPQDRIKS